MATKQDIERANKWLFGRYKWFSWTEGDANELAALISETRAAAIEDCALAIENQPGGAWVHRHELAKNIRSLKAETKEEGNGR